MLYRLSEIVRAVRVILDENAVSKQLLDERDIDTLTLDEIVLSKIADAARITERSAPVNLLDSGNNFGDAILWGDQSSGSTILPEDFFRLIAFKMSDWSRAVYQAITDRDPRYPLQASKWKGIRGTPEKPVCAIVMRPEGKVLEFYSCKDDTATVDEAVYLPYPKIENDGIRICERCYPAVLYEAAGLSSQSSGEADKAEAFFNTVKELLTNE